MSLFYKHLLITLLFSGAFIANSQSRITIEDRENLLSIETNSLLSEKLKDMSMELTTMVNFSQKCAYYFGKIEKNENQLKLSLRNCDDQLLGAKRLSSSILEAAPEEQATLVFYSLRDMIENPEMVTVNNAGTQISFDETQHDSRYFFAPTAYQLKKGDFYYNTLNFLVHDIQIGFSDYFSMGFGTTIVGFPMYITANLGFPVGEKTQIGFGNMTVIGTFDSEFLANLTYGTISRGTKESNLSFSLGYAASNDNYLIENSSSLVYNLSGIKKLSKYAYILTENYFFSYTEEDWATNTASFFQERFERTNRLWFGISGIRIVRRTNELVSWQFGLTYLTFFAGDYPDKYKSNQWDVFSYDDEPRLIAFPTLSYTRKFNLGN
jgi:hypothetical protein